MEYRQMGRSGLRLSVLGLGSYLTIGYKCDEETSRAMVRAAYEGGINFFDSANAYNTGEGERALGKCLKDYPRSSSRPGSSPAHESMLGRSRRRKR